MAALIPWFCLLSLVPAPSTSLYHGSPGLRAGHSHQQPPQQPRQPPPPQHPRQNKMESLERLSAVLATLSNTQVQTQRYSPPQFQTGSQDFHGVPRAEMEEFAASLAADPAAMDDLIHHSIETMLKDPATLEAIEAMTKDPAIMAQINSMQLSQDIPSPPRPSLNAEMLAKKLQRLEEEDAMLRPSSHRNAKVHVSEPVPLNLQPPRTNHAKQQDELLVEEMVKELSDLGIMPSKISEAQKAAMLADGMTPEDLDYIMDLADKARKKVSGQRPSKGSKPAFSDEDIRRLSQMSEGELESLANQMTRGPGTDLVMKKRKKRSSNKKVRRSPKKSPEEKISELERMIARLEDTKKMLMAEIKRVRQRAGLPTHKKSKRSIDSSARQGGAAGSNPSKKAQEGPIAKLLKRKKAQDKYKESLEPDLSVKQIKELMASMKKMIDVMQGQVHTESATRKRSKRSTSTSGKKSKYPVSGPEFSFMDFGEDEKGTYSAFSKKRPARSLASLMRGEAEPERVVPTYFAPDFEPNPEFTSGVYTSRELPPPPKELLSRQRRQYGSANYKSSGSKRQKRMSMDFLFPKKSPAEELVYFSVSQEGEAVSSEKLKSKHRSASVVPEGKIAKGEKADDPMGKKAANEAQMAATLEKATLVKTHAR